MICENTDMLKKALDGVLAAGERDVRIVDEKRLRETLIDDLIRTAVFAPEEGTRAAARWLIRRTAAAAGISVSSIQGLYEAMGRGEVSGFTVPAINIRALTYDTAQAVFRAALAAGVGAMIFEIARSEIDYTRQRPEEYTCAVLAAALKTGYRGPLFLQGDHFQVGAKKYAKDPEAEVRAVKDLIWEAIDAGFYNIDIDTSTLVDLAEPTVARQQRLNYTLAAELTTMIRDLEPAGITISVGGEIGEVGGKNSTVEELRAFMDGYREVLEKSGTGLKGISKISVQTGTTHGGVPLADGSVARVKLDFETLAEALRGGPGRIRPRRGGAARRLDAAQRGVRPVPGDRHGGDPPRDGFPEHRLRQPELSARPPGADLRLPEAGGGLRPEGGGYGRAVHLQDPEEGGGPLQAGAVGPAARGPGGPRRGTGGAVRPPVQKAQRGGNARDGEPFRAAGGRPAEAPGQPGVVNVDLLDSLSVIRESAS